MLCPDAAHNHLIAIGTHVSEKSTVLGFVDRAAYVAWSQRDKSRLQKVPFFTLVGINCPFIQYGMYHNSNK